MQRMKSVRFTPFLFALSLSLSAQPGAVRPSGPPAAAGASEAARGIDKKDIRFLIVYDEGAFSPAEQAQMRNSVEQLAAEAKAVFFKIEISDERRAAGAAPGWEAMGGTPSEAIARAVATGSRIVGVAFSGGPGGANAKPNPCPPQGCGCTDQGGSSCDCGLYRGHCYCTLCLPKSTLTWFPEEDPVLTSLPIKGGRRADPGGDSPRGKPAYVIVVAAKPGAPPQLVKQLFDSGIKTLQSEPWPAGLSIKEKSSYIKQ